MGLKWLRLRGWYALHLRGRVLPAVALLALGTLAALYLAGVIPEDVAGLILAGLIVVGLSGYAAIQLLGTQIPTALAVGLPVATALVAMAPVIATLHPGHPLVHGSLTSAGQSLPVRGLPRHVRVLLHADFGTVTASSVDVVLGLGSRQVEGHLDRQVSWGRVGRGRGKVTREHNSQFVSADLPADVSTVTLQDMRGVVPGGLEVEVFRDWVPFTWESAVAGVLLLVAVVLVGPLRSGAGIAAALAVPLAFGLAIYSMATPDFAVRSQLGALLVAALLGTLAGGTLGWLSGRLRRAD